MSDLADKKCIPCEGGIPSFNINEIHKYLKKVDGWDVKSDDQKTYYLLKEFHSRLLKGGLLLCSGILSSDVDKTIDKLKSSGFISLDSIQEEDWFCLELRIA